MSLSDVLGWLLLVVMLVGTAAFFLWTGRWANPGRSWPAVITAAVVLAVGELAIQNAHKFVR